MILGSTAWTPVKRVPDDAELLRSGPWEHAIVDGDEMTTRRGVLAYWRLAEHVYRQEVTMDGTVVVLRTTADQWSAREARRRAREQPGGLWGLYMLGPDEWMAAPSLEAAREEADRLNAHFRAQDEPGLPHIEALVCPWPGTVADHTHALALQDECT